ncbi:MAG: aromatic ring-hydroxylating dioxygenase subunit alpha [Ilumatobacter sp.]|uniref:aromatic ring-hydroxylating dioxygenase subunit alpha n=1 Tax=Ilumatobacter sp. TaxID=1967498 RepID=UPI002611C072|nr:aromatic ring-hydroxylating dioxygenase subunit alpha [Ilumatobacter sp.]MDJ0767664.1 aromatic ring-hydroxylating dioxygenase subunit alpha [Ilumatobacter sp.]
MSRLIDAPALRDHWYVVAESTDLADAPLAITLLGSRFVLWRGPAGAVVATADRCPHREAPLSDGRVHDGCLTCPYHGWTFGSAGECVRVPSTAEGVPIPPAAHLEALPTLERYGLVWLCPGTPTGEPCVIGEEDDPAFRRINAGLQVWQTDVTRMVDNFLDVTHFPFVHVGTFGTEQPMAAPAVDIEQLDADFTGYRYEVDVSDAAGRPVHRAMSTGFSMPFTVRSTIRHVTGAEAGLDHVLVLCSTPVDTGRSLFTFVVWRNDDHATAPEEAIAFDRAIGEEDRRMLERLDGELPLDARRTVSVQADRASLEWRRRLRALVSGPGAG